MTKRKRFFLTSIVLSLGFFTISLLNIQSYKFIGIGVLGLLTIILFIWSLWGSLGKNPTLLSLILPLAFTIGVGLFWFLLPVSWLSRIPIILFFAIGIYSLTLTTNIYTVAAIRTIALFRAAKGVGFLFTLITLFLIFDTILSLRSNIVITSILIILASVPLYMQGFWSTNLSEVISRELLTVTLFSALITGEFAINIFFWPVTVVVGSLFLTIASYILLGLGQAKLEGRLFKQTVREYLAVGIVVFIMMLASTHWG